MRMDNKVKREQTNSQQVLWVAIGQFCAYAIGFVSPMILSRYFDKGDYGTYKQVMYIYFTLLTVFSLGLPRAYSYFIPRVDLSQSKDVVKKISHIFFVMGLLFSLVLFVGAHVLSELLNNPDLERALQWFAPTPLFLLPVMGLDGILASYKKTQYLAIYTITTKLFSLLCILVPVLYFNGTYVHAIIGFDIASLLTFLLAVYLRTLPTKKIELVDSKISYRDILKFSIPLLTSSLWILIISSSNQFFISRYYGNEVFAEFTNGFMDFPIIPMIIQSIATVLTPILSNLTKDSIKEVGVVWKYVLSKSIKIIYPISVFSIMFADLIMVCLYGDLYENSGVYFVIKNIETFFVVVPFFPILIALNRTKEYSIIHMKIAFAIIVVDFICVKLVCAAYLIAVVYLICSIIKTFMQFRLVAQSIDVKCKSLIPRKELIKTLFTSVSATIVPYFMAIFFSDMNKFILLILSLVTYVLCYYLLCWMTRLSYKDVVEGYIANDYKKKIFRIIP